MAEEVLVKEVLASEEIAAGEKLLKRLDDAAADVIAAYWIYEPEVGAWQLELVSPQVESEGPLEFYSKVNKLLSAEPKLSTLLGLNIINVLGPRYSFYRSLASTLKPYKKLSGVRLNRTFVGGQLVDLYVYRFPTRRVVS